MKTPNEELKKGVELCFKNVNGLIESAKILVEHGDYGYSQFLSLSAIEETSKAFIYALERIGAWKDDETTQDVFDRKSKFNIFNHKSKFSMFYVVLLIDAVGERMQKGNITMDRPLDIADFEEMGKDMDSAVNDLKVGREESLYVDYQNEKWVSPFDISREDAETVIRVAQKLKTKVEPLCKGMAIIPLEKVKEVNEFFDKLRLSVRDQIYKNADKLYAEKKITKKLYEQILKSKANQRHNSTP